MNDRHQQELDWEAVYTEQLPRIYNFFRYRVGDNAVAEDLTAAAFERAWKHRGRYRRDLSAFSTWLFTIARNLAIDHFRRIHPETTLDETHSSGEDRPVEEAVQHDHDLQRLNALLADLNAREREVIALKFGADLTNRAIAGITGLSESNVGTILHRAVGRLRAAWEVVE